MDTNVSQVRRLRTLALLALCCAAVVLLASKQPWWRDSSALRGAELEQALANAPTQAVRDCLNSGGIPIGTGEGQCQRWEVLHPALGYQSDAQNTFGGSGNSVVNDGRPQPLFGFPAPAVFAAAAFAFVVLAAALRSLLASVASVLAGLQAYRSLSALAGVINQPVEGLPMLQPTIWFTLFKATIVVGMLVTAGGVLVWNATERSRERRERLADGSYIPLGEKFRVVAQAAAATSARSMEQNKPEAKP
jgi:hypothetical protein